MSDKTIQIYDARAQDYADLVSDAEVPGLEAFIGAMPRGAKVLDLGCGPGHCAGRMAAAGCEVLALDASAEMVALAREHPDVTARQATFDTIDGEDLYDGIWASFSLLHAPKSALPRHLAALHRAAKPGARLYVAVKTGAGEHIDSIGRFYAYYAIDELDGFLEAAGFRVADHQTGEDKGLSGDISPWVAVTAYA